MEYWIADFIKNIGFPTFVALFLLVRFDKRFGEIKESLKDIVSELKKFNGKQ